MRHWIAATGFAVLTFATALAPAAEVWIGGSRAWGELVLPENESKWAFLRENVAGLYINNFAMRPAEGPDDQRARNINGMYRLLASKKLFYETDLVNASDDFDRDAIAQLRTAGFEYVGTTINRNTTPERTKIITLDGKVPLYYMLAPWKLHGDINHPDNQAARESVLKFAGASIDGPVVVFRDTPAGRTNKAATYSLIKWVHAEQKKFLWLLAPNDSGPGYVAEVQDDVRQTEDAGASPDIWAVVFYGPKAFREKLDVVPEADADGRPAKTYTGAAYWLAHHLRDPKGWARLSLPHGAAADGKVFAVDLANRSDWLDLTPVLRLTDTAGYRVTATLDGRDVTAELAGDGLVFNRADRLAPGATRRLQMTLARTSAAAGAGPAITLSPHPSELTRVNQTLRLTGDVVATR